MRVAQTIVIAAALLLRSDGHMLLVRKRGTTAFMQPGGKLAEGETALQALVRELDEELWLRIDPAQTTHLGEFEAEAANEPGCRVRATLYLVRTDDMPVVAAEIEQAEWIDPAYPGALTLAPLTRDLVLPLAASIVEADWARLRNTGLGAVTV